MLSSSELDIVFNLGCAAFAVSPDQPETPKARSGSAETTPQPTSPQGWGTSGGIPRDHLGVEPFRQRAIRPGGETGTAEKFPQAEQKRKTAPAETIPGISSGNVISRRMVQVSAPMSRAASSRAGSKL